MAPPSVAYDYREMVVSKREPLTTILERLQEMGDEGWLNTGVIDHPNDTSFKVFIMAKPRPTFRSSQIL